MQRRPDAAALLDAIAQFLMTELQPHVSDKRLNFRVLIAANLATIVASELRGRSEYEAAELERLRALLPDSATLPLDSLNQALAERLRTARELDPAWLEKVRAHLQTTLTDTLAVMNPRFDTSQEID